MGILRRLPIYAAGVGFTVATVAVASTRSWSGAEVALSALIVGTFYIVTILVPWLIREQLAQRNAESLSALGERSTNTNGDVVTLEGELDRLLGFGHDGAEMLLIVEHTTSDVISVPYSEPILTAR